MKICNHCNAVNADNAQVCCKCGNQLEACQCHIGGGSIGFRDAVRICLKEKYASFEGRATRSEYWYFALFYFLVLIAGAIVGGILGALFSGGDENVTMSVTCVVYGLVALSVVCPAISVFVRRLHDTGRSGWWYWLALVPYVGGIVLFVFTLLGSQERDNEYGSYRQ